MMVSEVVVGLANDDERDTKMGVAVAGGDMLPFNLGRDTSDGGTPSDCANVRGPGNQIRGDYAVLNNKFVPNAKASRWLDGRNIYGLYKATLPPNSPSCIAGVESDANEEIVVWSASMISASSYHTGGVNVCMADGAVRFVSDSVDCGDIDKKLGEALSDDDATGYYWAWTGSDGVTPNLHGTSPAQGHWWMGESTYGVWGALATPAGGESKSL
jgi:prepilin-type processing-associated H-X9-DG protein